MTTRRFDVSFSKKWSALIAGSLLLSTTQAAQAAGEMRFREFRQENPDLSKRECRQIFRAEFRNPSPNLDSGGQTRHAEQIGKSQMGGGTNSRPLNQINGLQDAHIRNQSVQLADSGRAIRLNGGVDLDLTSGERNITLGKNLFQNVESIEIVSGGETKEIKAGSQVSAAEFIAVKQVLNGGQKLSIDRAGRANGGEVDLDAITSNNDVMRAAEFVVAKDVTAYGDFGKRSDFRLLGDLNNYGTVIASSGDAAVRSGALRADDINNYKGATISSIVDLTLDASGRLKNEGTISSTAGLTITAGDLVDNTGSISASGDLNILSSRISNRGSLQSGAGNVNLDGATSKELLIDNHRGTISAAGGAISVRAPGFDGAFDTYLMGGDLYSQELNLHSGQGTMTVMVNDLTGVVNETGLAAHLTASTDVLNLGEICLTGDPTFYNQNGNLFISGDMFIGEDIVLVAAGNITSGMSVDIRAGNGTQGFNVTLIAGADFDVLGGNSISDVTGVTPTTNAGEVTLSGKRSKFGGGFISMGPSTTINTRATGTPTNSNGGNVNLFAFEGKNTNSGSIDTLSTSITTGGTGTGANGEIKIIASNKDTIAINAGAMSTKGGSGVTAALTGDIELGVGKITAIGGDVVYNKLGARIGTNELGLKSAGKSGGIRLSGGVVSARDINVQSAGVLELNASASANDEVTIGMNGNLVNGAAGKLLANNAVTIVSGDNLGTISQPVQVSAPGFAILDKSGITDAFVSLSGFANIGVNGAEVKGDLVLNAPSSQLGGFSNWSAENISVTANSFGSIFADIVADSNLTITQLNGNLTSSAFTALGAERLTLFTGNGNIASAVLDPFLIPDTVDQVSAFASGFISFERISDDALVFDQIKGGNVGVFLKSGGSIDLANTVESTGAISVQIAKGTMTVRSALSSNDLINLIVDQSDTKGKIKLEQGASVKTDSVSSGSIKMSVGPTSAKNFNPDPQFFDIEETGGFVNVTGAGISGKDKGGINQLIAKGANLDINNGLAKATSISFAGAVVVEADPPVAPGTPTYTNQIASAQSDPKLNGIVSGALSGAEIMEQSDMVTTGLQLAGSSSADAGLSSLQAEQILNGIDSAGASIVNTITSTSSSSNGWNGEDSYILVKRPSFFQHDATVYSDRKLDIDTVEIPSEFKLSLNDGISIVVPSSDTMIEAELGSIEIAGGSVVMISNSKRHLTLYNLHDGVRNGVTVIVNGKKVPVLPGRHASIAVGHVPSFADINPIESVAHRRVAKFAIGPEVQTGNRRNPGKGGQLFTSEFSVVSAIDAIKQLKSIVSSNQKEAVRTSRQILKTGAVLMHLGGQEQFELQVKAQKLALR